MAPAQTVSQTISTRVFSVAHSVRNACDSVVRVGSSPAEVAGHAFKRIGLTSAAVLYEWLTWSPGASLPVLVDILASPVAGSAAAGGTLGEGWTRVDIAKEVFTEEAVSQTVVVGVLPAGARLVGAIARVTEGFALAGSALTIALGAGVDPDALVEEFDPASPTSKGAASADLGASLSAGAGGYLASMTAATNLTLTLVSDTADLGSPDGNPPVAATDLSAGAVSVFLKVEQLPLT